MPLDDWNARETNLERRIDLLGSWMIGFTWAVVVGLVIEFYAVFDPAWTGDWNRVIDRIGLLLVTIGVAGELAVEHKTHQAERKLRDVTAEIKRDADFKLKAADERIAELNAQTERLRKQNKDTALLLAYRSILDTPAFEDAMRAFSGTKYTIEVFDSMEAINFQWRLNMALRNSGWLAVRNPGRRLNLGFGVSVMTVGNQNAILRSEAGEALASWLDDDEIATITAVVAREDLELQTLVIEVGPKPETIEQQTQIRSEYKRRLQVGFQN